MYYCFSAYGGVSLGQYLFVHREADDLLVRHELGHSRQSLLLGPIYLVIVGLPSLIWAGLFPFAQRLNPSIDYFGFFTESWANRLAGITRGAAADSTEWGPR